MKINVNGHVREVDGAPLTYEAVVKIAGDSGYPTVTFRSPHRDGYPRRDGTMYTGGRLIEPEEGMVFDVIHTGNG